MEKKKKIQVVMLIAAVFLCGILYLTFGPGRMSAGADTEKEAEFVAGGASGRSSGGVSGGSSGGEAQDGSETGTDPDQSDAFDSEKTKDTPVTGGNASAKGTVYVYICGAVKHPGVYTFDRNPRVVEVVDKAGGFKKRADTLSVNLAGVCEDGAQVVIAEKGKAGADDSASADNSGSTGIIGDSDSMGGTSDASGDGRIDINTAGAEELTQIPGIGEAKSTAIVNYRNEHGRFQKPEDLMQIPGIKEGIFNRIKDYIRV